MVEPKPESLPVTEDDGVSTTQHESPDEHVGAFLREARENTGRSLTDVAVMLRIGKRYLQSIEDGRYEDLPGQTYAVGFIRSYADYLGLDTEALVAQFKAQSDGAEGQPELEFPVPATVGWFPTGKVVAVCALLAVAVFAGWFFVQTENTVDVSAIPIPPGFEPNIDVASAIAKPRETIAAAASASEPVPSEDEEPPVETVVAATAPAGSSDETSPAATEQDASDDVDKPYVLPVPIASLVLPDPVATEADLRPSEPVETVVEESPAETVVEEIPSAPVTPTPVEEASDEAAPVETNPIEAAPIDADRAAPPPVAAAPEPDPIPSAPQVAAVPDNPAEGGTANANGNGRTYGVNNTQARVVIGAQADSWVQVTDDNQNVVLAQMLRAGDRYLVPNRQDLVMSTGNAGGLVISVDGTPVPDIGADGTVTRNVRLDVELLKAGRAVVP